MTTQSTSQSGTTSQPVTAPIPVAGTRTEHPEAQGYLRQLNIGDLELESGVTPAAGDHRLRNLGYPQRDRR